LLYDAIDQFAPQNRVPPGDAKPAAPVHLRVDSSSLLAPASANGGASLKINWDEALVHTGATAT
jgi:hypothetical protein